MEATRDFLRGKQTPGRFHVGTVRPGSSSTVLVLEGVVGVLSEADKAVAMCGSPEKDFTHVNAALYAEAHNVANEHGMWPLDMVARIRELEEAMKHFCSRVDRGEVKSKRTYAEFQRVLNNKP